MQIRPVLRPFNRTGYGVPVVIVLLLCALVACALPPQAPASGPPGTTVTPASAVAKAPPAPVPTVAAVEPAPGNGLVTVNVQVAGTLAEAAMYIATDRGYFAKNGISPQFITFDSAAKAVPALWTGQIDVAAGVLSGGLFNAVGQGVDIRVVAPQTAHRDCAHTGAWVLVRKDLVDNGAIQSPVDLRGRKIAGVSKASTVEFLVDALLRKGGLQSSDAEYVEVSFGDMGAAFASRGIDVAIGSEPTATSYVDQGLASKWLCGADILPDFQYTYLMYSGQFANQRTTLAQRWMAAYVRGARDWQQMLATGDGKDAIFATIAKFTPLKNMALLERLSLPMIVPEEAISAQDIQAQISWGQERGYVTTPPSVSALIDNRFVERAPRAP
jgi:NitT/TauT family transport system substrate-binding protein